MGKIFLAINGGGVTAYGVLGSAPSEFESVVVNDDPDALRITAWFRDLDPARYTVFVEFNDGSTWLDEVDLAAVGPDASFHVDAPWRAGPTQAQWTGKATRKAPLGGTKNVLAPDYVPPPGWTPPGGFRPPTEQDVFTEPDDKRGSGGLWLLFAAVVAAVAAS